MHIGIGAGYDIRRELQIAVGETVRGEGKVAGEVGVVLRRQSELTILEKLAVVCVVVLRDGCETL